MSHFGICLQIDNVDAGVSLGIDTTNPLTARAKSASTND